MNAVFIARGSGYADDTTFAPYEILRTPLARRADRIIPYRGNPVSYESHEISYAKERGYNTAYTYLLLRHGGGTEVVRLHLADPIHDMILAHPDEQVVYATLYSIYRAAKSADASAREKTAAMYESAFLEGRLKKSRLKQGVRRVRIEPKPKPRILPVGA